MHLLNLLPVVKNILDKNITSCDEREKVEEKLKEIDIKELENKLKSKESMGNSSFFVSGSIPALLWMLVIVIFFNYIISPFLQGFFNITIPLLNLPDWYSGLCSTIILGLFAKKSWDSTDITIGKFSKKSKYESESNTTNKNIEVLERANRELLDEEEDDCDEDAIDVNPEVLEEIEEDIREEEEKKHKGSKSNNSKSNKQDKNNQEYVNKRYEEILKEYDIQ